MDEDAEIDNMIIELIRAWFWRGFGWGCAFGLGMAVILRSVNVW